MAEIRAKSTDQRKTHDISLSDGTTEIGLTLSNFKGQHDPNAIKQVGNPRTALQIRQGQAEYSDFEMPYTPIIQNDWSGGLGNRYLDKDKSRFRMSYRMDSTKPYEIKLGPREFHPAGVLQLQADFDVNSMIDEEFKAIPEFIAVPDEGDPPLTMWFKIKIIPEFTETNPTIRIVAATSLANHEMEVSVYSDDGGDLDAELWGTTITVDANYSGAIREYININPVLTMTAATAYWLIIRAENAFEPMRLFGESYTSGTVYTNNSDSPTVPVSWTSETSRISLAIFGNGTTGKSFKFEYRKSMYMVTSPDDDSAPRLYREGYHGLAQANTGHLELLKTGLTLATTSILNDAFAIIVAGKGSEESTNWRKIISNTLDGDITVSPSWKVVHDATTEYAIVGTHEMHLIGSTGLTKPITSVLVTDSIVYFAQGDATNIRRMREYNNSGTWTRQFDDDGSNQATFLARGPKTDGTQQIWRANNDPPACSYSGLKAWGTNLSFSSDILCGDSFNKITNLIFYGNPLIPWVLKEDRFGSISDGIFAEVPISEMRNVSSPRNGVAALHFGVYLYFSLLGGLERYYDGRLDDVGPNRDEGMYDIFKGNISALASYPGRFYASIDGGSQKSGNSSVLCHNGIGWHNIYSVGNKRIRDLHIQTLPDGIDRLWFSEDSEPTYLYISLDELDAQTRDGKDLFARFGFIDLSTLTAGFKDINKFFTSISTFGYGFYASGGTECRFYRIYDSMVSKGRYSQESIDIATIDSDSESVILSPGVGEKELNIKIIFYRDEFIPSNQVLNAVRVDAVTRIPIKRSWSVMFRIQTREVDMNGDHSSMSAIEIYNKLEAWANSDVTPAPLILRSNHGIFDNRTVFIDPASLQPLRIYNTPGATSENETMYIGQLSVYEA